MAHVHWERLSAIDAAFLDAEDTNAHMHIGSVGIFEIGPLEKDGGGLDFERILEFADSRIHKMPRFRQKIARVPGFAQPVWVDDESFNLTYHMRHTSLPRPGNIRRLKRLAGRILSQQLDRGKPLWEQWFVEGLEGERFAVITKLHHCMADGISGSDALSVLMGTDPNCRIDPAPKWAPRSAPTGRRLLLEEVRHLLSLPFSLLPDRQKGFSLDWNDLASSRKMFQEWLTTLPGGLPRMTRTSLNEEIGPHRRFDWATFDFDEVRVVASAAGGKVNDVALAVVSGALRRFMKRRGETISDLTFRALIPVSLRSQAERGNLGNRVSALMVELPLDEEDPWKRLLCVVDRTRQLKESGQSSAAELLERLIEFVPPRLSSGLTRLVVRSPLANLVVTNVPGPRSAVYMLGARMLEIYPVLPLGPNLGLGVALYSYDGGLYWGFNSDWDALPDLHDFAEEIQMQFDALRKSSPGGQGATARKKTRRKRNSPGRPERPTGDPAAPAS